MTENAAKPAGKTDRKFYLSVLGSTECQCERPKKRGHAFCFTCYHALSFDMRDALYMPIGAGFEKAYDDACCNLND